jgi:hypothetical protein
MAPVKEGDASRHITRSDPFAAHVSEIGSTQKFSVPCLFGVLHGFGEPALACFNR